MVVRLQKEIPQFKAIQNEEGESNIPVCPLAVMEKLRLLSLLFFISVPGVHIAPNED